LNLANDTLVIFMTDNGHSVPSVYNAGMRAMKGTPYQGGIRVPSFWRWPGKLPRGVDCEALTAHLDLFPTLAELAGQPASEPEDGRSLLPLLENPQAPWRDRLLFTHLGRWEAGQAQAAKHRGCAVRNSRFKLVNNTELYDLEADPAEARNVINEHPEITEELRAAYERWWVEVLPSTVENELARGPAVNSFKQRFWDQYGKPAGTNAWAWKMNPDLKFDPDRPRL
jgi:arylsulfatase A-like enzyme